jgi:hypothetical protein
MQDLTEVFMENWMESAPSTLVTTSTQRGYARFFFFYIYIHRKKIYLTKSRFIFNLSIGKYILTTFQSGAKHHKSNQP